MSNLNATGNIELSLKTQIQNTELDGTISSSTHNKTLIQDSLGDGVAADQISRAWERKSWSLASGQSEVIDIFDFDNLDIGAGEGRDILGQLLLCNILVGIVITVESGAGRLEVEPDGTFGFDPIGIHTVANDGAIKVGGAIVKYAPCVEGFAIAHRDSQRIKFTAAGGDVVYSVRLILRDVEGLPPTLDGLDLWMRADLDVSTGGARQLTLANTEYFEIADNASLSTGDVDFTFAGWVYLDSKATDQYIAAKWGADPQAEWLLRYDTSSDRFRFFITDAGSGGSTSEVTSNTFGAVSVGQWHFVVVEHDSVGDTISISVNDEAAVSGSHVGGTIDGTSGFRIGTQQSGGALSWDGRLARCGFWKRTLTTDERSQLYNSGRSLFYNELPSPLLTNLISYWNLNEPSGNAIDAHSTNDLTDTNTVTAADGITPRVRQFAIANSEHFSVASNATLSQSGDFTIAGWVNLDGTSGERALFTKYNTSGNNREYRLVWNGSTSVMLFAVSGTGESGTTTELSATAFGALTVGDWYYVIAEHDAAANTISLQINDTAIEATPHTGGVFAGTSDFNIGRRVGGAYMGGKLSRIGFWSRTLTALERTTLYNSGRGLSHADLSTPMKTSLISFWDLNEVSGDAFDSEGTNDLTDNNTVTSLLGPFEATGPVIDGDPVSQWLDRSGSGKAFTQATLAKRPIYRLSGINSLPSIEFDGVDDLLVLAEDYLTGTEGTVIAVLRFTSTPSGAQDLLTTGDVSGAETARMRAASPANTAMRVNDGVNDNLIKGSSIVVSATNYLQVWMSDGTSYTIRLNGADETLSVTTGLDNGSWFGDVSNQDNVVIGATKNVSEVQFLGARLSELIVYDHELSASELLTIETYLATRYGITLAT